MPERAQKQALLFAITKARAALPLSAALKVPHLSSSRYHAWVRSEQDCELDDRKSCPQSIPQRLTPREILSIKSMVLSKAHRHMSVRGLALHAQRVGKVLAHPVTWYKLIRQRGWTRPRVREYPAKPKVGIRATKPNEARHVYTSIIKLLMEPRPTCTQSCTTTRGRSWLGQFPHHESFQHVPPAGRRCEAAAERHDHGNHGLRLDEMYFGRGEHVPDELSAQRAEARRRRVDENRRRQCSTCPNGRLYDDRESAA